MVSWCLPVACQLQMGSDSQHGRHLRGWERVVSASRSCLWRTLLAARCAAHRLGGVIPTTSAGGRGSCFTLFFPVLFTCTMVVRLLLPVAAAVAPAAALSLASRLPGVGHPWGGAGTSTCLR